jgi:hypothetical protein
VIAPIAAILSVLAGVVVPAVRDTHPAPPPTTITAGPCGQWADTATAAGWAAGEWPTVARVMWCESRCQPTARNRSGAAGLMEVMPGWWGGRDPYDPAANLTMALEVWHAQGWRAWSCA